MQSVGEGGEGRKGRLHGFKGIFFCFERSVFNTPTLCPSPPYNVCAHAPPARC